MLLAYPFTKLPTFFEFRERLEKDYKCKYKIDDDKTPFPIQYFEKGSGKKKITCAVSFNNDAEILTPSVLRSICKRLKINPKHFGLLIG